MPCIVCCNTKNASTKHLPTGNVLEDYFYSKGYDYPFYCDSLKPIIKPGDSIHQFVKFQGIRAKLAANACSIIRSTYKTDSLSMLNPMAFAVFPVNVYYNDSPKVWYRVLFREYKNFTKGKGIEDNCN